MSGLSATSKKAVISVLVISLVLLFGSMTSPLLNYIAGSYVGETFFLIVQVPSFVGMAVSFAIGPLAMKVNMKWLMVACAVAALAYFLIFAIVGSNGPFVALLIGAGIVGICQGGAMVLTSSILGAYVYDPLQRANFVAISGALMNGGAAVVNVVGGAIAAGNGGANWPNAYWLGLLIIPALIIFWIMMPMTPDAAEPPTGGPEGGPEAAGPPAASGFIPAKVFLIIGMGLVVSLGMCAFLFNVGIYLTGELFEYGYTSLDSGLANSLFTIFGVIAGFTFPFVSKPLGSLIAPVGYALGALGLAMLFLFPSSIMMIFVGASVIGLGFNLAMPFVTGQIMAITPPRWIPTAMSINMGIMGLIMGFAPNLLAVCGNLFGGTIAAQLKFGTIVVLVGVVISFFLFVLWKNPAPASQQEG